MSRRLVVDDLINEVRSIIDENNTENIDDDDDILPALNRAQDYAADLLARQYEEPLLTYTTLDLIGGTSEYSIPSDVFEQRVEKVEINIPDNSYQEVKRISYRDISQFESTSVVNVPDYYCVVGNKIRLVPKPSGSYDARVWYLKDPEPLVVKQGRITSVNTGSNYIIVDSLGSDLTTSADNLNCYINVVDGATAQVKCSLQINAIDTANNKITFKASPSRTSVLNKTISTAIPSTVAADDFICLIHGSCVPFLKKPISNFLINHAATEIKVLKLGEPGELLLRIKEDFENQVKHTWAGRETSIRVKRTNKFWNPFRR